MKILKVFGLIIFIISLFFSYVAITVLMGDYELKGYDILLSIIAFSLTICLGYLFRKTLLKILLIPFQVLKRDMNKNQKIVLAIFVPIIIFFITFMIANLVGVTVIQHTGKAFDLTDGGRMTNIRTIGIPHTEYRRDPLDWQKTWGVWLVFLIIICIFEYKLFEDKKKKDKELTGG